VLGVGKPEKCWPLESVFGDQRPLAKKEGINNSWNGQIDYLILRVFCHVGNAMSG
jgi:hypothetical protein